MIRLLLTLSLGSLLFAPAFPVSAAVLAEGAPKNGYYWQKSSTKSGSIRYLCCSPSSSKFQNQ